MTNTFTQDVFDFLTDLQANNSRDWFQANKKRYEDAVVESSLAFISAFDQRLATITGHIEAVPKRVGGSLFRIYRDTRFGHDKTPYKTHVGIHFRHRQAKDVHCPSFYLHLEPGGVFAGAGIWRPDRDALASIRTAIVERTAAWRKVAHDADFRARFKLDGESLKRPPRGFDAEHPAIEDLKRKDFIAVQQLDEAAVLESDFVDQFADVCRSASDYVRFLCTAVGVPY
jgi:uncharacterized protein (TIGR02453 family)